VSDGQEYLVHIDVNWPADGDRGERMRLIEAESARASELIAEGTIVRLWRDPGKWSNWGIWRASGHTELHAAISSLPFFPWLAVTVHPLAAHPSDPSSGLS
jgi:muconolactone D-isomerase